MKAWCVLSLESLHRGDSNEKTQYTIFNLQKENHPKLSEICRLVIFSKGQLGQKCVSTKSFVDFSIKFCGFFHYIFSYLFIKAFVI